MGQINHDPHGPARVPSRFEIVNALAWILAREDELRAGGGASSHVRDQALRDHEAILVEHENDASAGTYQAARTAWASMANQNDARVLAVILQHAADLCDEGEEHNDAIERAIALCQGAWAQATRLRAVETHELARRVWAAANEGDPCVGPGGIVDRLDEILERALALRAGGHELADAITSAIREHGASGTLARIAVVAWAITCTGGGEPMADTSGAMPKGGA